MVRLPRPLPSVVGLGPFLKATITLIEGTTATISRPAGDLGTPEAILRYRETAERLLSGVELRAAAHDLHPDFYSTHYAEELDLPLIAVQHHHAHIAALAAEHGYEELMIGLALDGFGLSPEGEAWGGELLLVEGADCERIGHMATLPQPGGDAAAREPWRMGAAALHVLGRGDEIASRFAAYPQAGPLAVMLDKDVNCPRTSSCGRLFDAACGLLGVCPVADFEGQAPMELEALVTKPEVMADGWKITNGVLDMTPLLGALADCAPERGADLFHGTLAAALGRWAEQTGVDVVGLSGGCFLNKVLTGLLVPALESRGIRVLTHKALPPGDECISLGQAWVAALTVERDGKPCA
ncbi:MAG: hydrogenase maturation protein HypF [Rhodospirillales bacterium RIFCSPLOWO2_12_FULL_58_28]|nr:MAG: hydrogenase maturation protein HypF [Rhodospirillales bacterium RIFCSPLOWO2_02_FULL_58_16]OHC79837.1 MAG: hydrogenase maturation protein HypF [Rhodospirillales bacterium RIFCSPLOWO2_12_FULL_58_28]